MSKAIPFAVLLGGLAIGLAGAGPDDELEAYLAAQKRLIDDPRRTLAERARTALEMAGALDRAALRAEDSGRRHALWAEAAARLDGFTARNPGHSQAAAFALQAAVYRWAQARSGIQQLERTPTDAPTRDQARAVLDDAIAQLQALAEPARAADDPLAQNVRYRLAQALADRATLTEDDADAARLAREQALECLGRPITETGLRGFAELLRADLLAALGRFDDAQAALDAAAKANPPPPAAERLAVRTAIAIGRTRFDEALRAIEAAP
ncbi:MAG TPA: hypothetical protein VF590_10435, partial [Isosphaeraceae bacterium]